MASRDIKQCVLPLQEMYKQLKEKSFASGIDMILTCTARTTEEQIALYAQGREDIAGVNFKRKIANMPPIASIQNKKVTWTLKSKHLTSQTQPLARAFDIVIVKDGSAQWSVKTNVNKNDIPDYVELAQIGKSIGLIAGADFKSPDYPHFEI